MTEKTTEGAQPEFAGAPVLEDSSDSSERYKVNSQLAQIGLSQKDEGFTLSDLLLGLGKK